MKTLRTIFIIVFLFAGYTSAMAQTKTKSKTSTSSQKKTAPKAISVYVCTSEKDKLFHKRRTCAGLNKCSNEIKYITSVSELKKWKRKSCTRCNK